MAGPQRGVAAAIGRGLPRRLQEHLSLQLPSVLLLLRVHIHGALRSACISHPLL